MGHRRNAVVTLALALGTAACSGGMIADSSEAPRVADEQVGWSIERPPGWREHGAIQATAFAAGARCRSAVIVDRQPPSGSGPAAPGVERSLVQVCARPRSDELSLEAWMQREYRAGFGDFVATDLGGRPAFRAGPLDRAATVFTQTSTHRLQIVTSAQARPALLDRRRSQVRRIVASLTL